MPPLQSLFGAHNSGVLRPAGQSIEECAYQRNELLLVLLLGQEHRRCFLIKMLSTRCVLCARLGREIPQAYDAKT